MQHTNKITLTIELMIKWSATSVKALYIFLFAPYLSKYVYFVNTNCTVYFNQTAGCGDQNLKCHENAYCERRYYGRRLFENCRCNEGLEGDGVISCAGEYSLNIAKV